MADLLKELEKEKSREAGLLNEVNNLLREEVARDKSILSRLKGEKHGGKIEESLNESRIFDLRHIKKLCIKYRLRFLDSSLYNKEFPYEAIAQIKELEKQLEMPLSDFRILAPKELFHLSDKDSDPILFLKLSENKYYMIHKWGGELNSFRSLLAFPMRNFMSMFWSLFVLALLFSYVIPTASWLSFAFLAVHSFIAICGMACMLMLSFRENFSEAEWDSKYLS